MLLLFGFLGGIGAALAVRGVLLALWPRSKGKPRRTASVPLGGWEHTRNFLYYDGTVMPKREESND